MNNTNQQYNQQIAICREIYSKKLTDYGTAWRIMRPTSITDQIMIKARRIRSIQQSGITLVGEGTRPEFIGIVNYAIMGLIQLQLGPAEQPNTTNQQALQLYDQQVEHTQNLLFNKNHDYDDAWRSMRISSITDLILMKIHRTKEIEDNQGKTIISEGIDANYMDMINYAIFALILLDSQNEKDTI